MKELPKDWWYKQALQRLSIMADDAAGKGRRTFRKFSYRGVDLDQLLDMSTDELVELFPARARRR